MGVETRTDETPDTDTRRSRSRAPSSQEAQPREAADESFAPDNLAPGQVGEARTTPKRGRSSARRRDGDGRDDANLDGSGDLAQDSRLAGETRESEIAHDTRNTPSQGGGEDYGRAHAADGKARD
jgi:hypothetical protein